MRFMLNHEVVELDNIDPNLSILGFLRTRVGLRGTKEGCASGDCGACTVVLLDQDADGQPRYLAVNSCIALMAQVADKHLITVEGLAKGADALHPVQQALVDFHGSQCGFCTPGIVMSLFALYQRNPNPTRDEVLDALSGNLCRCTGYRPIVDSALAWPSYASTAVQTWEPPQAVASQRLESSQQAGAKPADERVQDAANNCLLPRSEAQLQALLLLYPQARLLAGGTDLALEVTQQYKELQPLIALTAMPELQQIQVAADVLNVGAMTTYRELEAPLLKHFPAFGAMLQRLGSRQIRNLGTLGGNIANASPIGDTPPVLLALDARLQLASAQGTRQLPLREFFLGYKKTALAPGEYLRSVFIPKLPPQTDLKVYKVSKRFEDDISAVLGAFYLRREDNLIVEARLAFGGMAAIPQRAARAEQCLQGAEFCEASFQAAAEALTEDFKPLSDVRASAAYRLKVAQNLLLKAWIECSEPQAMTQVHADAHSHPESFAGEASRHA